MRPKTDQIFFTIKSKPDINTLSDKVENLGVHLDSKLTWHTKTLTTSESYSKKLYHVRDISKSVSQSCLLTTLVSFDQKLSMV